MCFVMTPTSSLIVIVSVVAFRLFWNPVLYASMFSSLDTGRKGGEDEAYTNSQFPHPVLSNQHPHSALQLTCRAQNLSLDILLLSA